MNPFGPYKAQVTEVHDGDTARMNLDLGFGLVINLSCRLYGINAPELNTPEGKVSRDALKDMLEGVPIDVYSYGWDKYGGRFDGELIAEGVNVNQWLVSHGYAVPYPANSPYA